MGRAAAVRRPLNAGEDEDFFPAPEIDPMKGQRPIPSSAAKSNAARAFTGYRINPQTGGFSTLSEKP